VVEESKDKLNGHIKCLWLNTIEWLDKDEPDTIARMRNEPEPEKARKVCGAELFRTC